jgi:GNAT superfamily N-acetyltransferase
MTAAVRVVSAYPDGRRGDATRLVFEYMASTMIETGRGNPGWIGELPPVLLCECRNLPVIYRSPGALLIAYHNGRAAGCAGVVPCPPEPSASNGPGWGGSRVDGPLFDRFRLDSARLDSARLDSARLDSARLDSARLDSTALISTAVIKRLYVRPTHRGHGIARALMNHAHHHAARHGIDRLVLDVLPARASVIDFCRRLGYTETEPYGAGLPASMVYLERLITHDDIQPSLGPS